MSSYRVLVGLEYAGRRAEAGDIVDDLPAKSVPWLTSQGIVEKADGKPAPEPEPTPTPEPSPTSKTRERQSPTKKGDD